MSGGLQVQTGSSEAGASGAMTLSMGTAVNGAGGEVVFEVPGVITGDGGTINIFAGASNGRYRSAGGALFVRAGSGTSSHSGAGGKGGHVVLSGGEAAGGDDSDNGGTVDRRVDDRIPGAAGATALRNQPDEHATVGIRGLRCPLAHEVGFAVGDAAA